MYADKVVIVKICKERTYWSLYSGLQGIGMSIFPTILWCLNVYISPFLPMFYVMIIVVYCIRKMSYYSRNGLHTQHHRLKTVFWEMSKISCNISWRPINDRFVLFFFMVSHYLYLLKKVLMGIKVLPAFEQRDSSIIID